MSKLQTEDVSIEYYSRLIRALDVHIRQALLDILHRSFIGIPEDGVQLYHYLHCSERELQKALRRKLISRNQWELLLPASGISNSKKWDITLIFFVISNLLDISPPIGGWRIRQPSILDKSISAYIVRARQLRNEIQHLTSTNLTLQKYQDYWSRITCILAGLNYRNMSEVESSNPASIAVEQRLVNMENRHGNLEIKVESIEQNLRNEDVTNQSYSNKTKLPDVNERFKKQCNQFIQEWKKNSDAFENVGKLGYFYHRSIIISTSGNKGITYLGFSNALDDGWLVIKRCQLKRVTVNSDDDLNNIEEVRILREIKAYVNKKGHINILDVHKTTSDKDFYYIITPLYDYTLKEFLETKPELSTRIEVLKQFFDATKELHTKRELNNDNIILHKDLKPNNIMIQMTAATKFNLKIIDFGESRKYESGRTKTRENVGDPIWLPPGISVDKDSRFTVIHEAFVVCMLAVYILTNGEHPFVEDHKELQAAYDCKKNISIRDKIDMDGNLVEFFNGKFREFFPYFHLIDKKDDLTESQMVGKKKLADTLSVSKISEELEKNVYLYCSPNHTRGHRLLAMLTFSEDCKKQRGLGKLFFPRRTNIPTAVPNCTILQNKLEKHNFEIVNTKVDMTVKDFLEGKLFVKAGLSLMSGKPIYFFLYILAHSQHDADADDVYFKMPIDENKKDENMYIGTLLSKINDVFKSEKLKIVLLYEGCRKICSSSGQSQSLPDNVVVFYSTEKGQPSKFNRNEEKFSTPWYYCQELVKHIESGKALKDVFNDTTEALSKIYAVKISGEKDRFEIRKGDSPSEGEKPFFLTPELCIKSKEILDFVF